MLLHDPSPPNAPEPVVWAESAKLFSDTWLSQAVVPGFVGQVEEFGVVVTLTMKRWEGAAVPPGLYEGGMEQRTVQVFPY